MDLKGSLVDTNLRIYLNEKAVQFLKTVNITSKTPHNIVQIIKSDSLYEPKFKTYINNVNSVYMNSEDLENLSKIKKALGSLNSEKNSDNTKKNDVNKQDEMINGNIVNEHKEVKLKENVSKEHNKVMIKKDVYEHDEEESEVNDEDNSEKSYGDYYVTTTDLDWLYDYIKSKHDCGNKTVPYLHTLLEGSHIEMPKNEVIKRNPVLEARCVKLRAQQEAREYRKMTKGVDNVRMKFPEDSISYQLKQVNRQLIAVGQFILSIFAGFLFGFRGVEWMVGNLDFGFRLLLGVMCALVIALAEIYFLAKKLNEELNIPETVQLGGPPKLADELKNKQHLD